ncbi:helix-hairpin-helix domain-containing protein [Fulvivirga maritima]|uniref:helix-hairpin-helix domain-containing protein n=1 Tax=Fulvivirga maritima TaxID=2904247 RepID=UPI001F34D03E|nr:helix-hairpin-helix domain-containing protein [Fulvivirga maritima]UII29361.1 helix-hairpin-helix domain-containing protein [Fulvivirga maritima]
MKLSKVIRWVKQTWSLSRGEARGLVIFLPLILLILFASTIYKSWLTFQGADLPDTQRLDEVMGLMYLDSAAEQEPEVKVILKPFDPNSISEAQLLDMGVKGYLAKNWVKYTSKGGYFNDKEDLKRLYGMSDTEYERLAPFVNITSKKKEKQSFSMSKESFAEDEVLNDQKFFKKKYEFRAFDINAADTTELKSLKGIGSAYANRIVKYRNALGGYVHKDQLKEVYGLNADLIKGLDTACYINEHYDPDKLNINKAFETELSRHPYINRKQAKAIVNYRYQHGDFSQADDLLKIKLLDSAQVYRLKPYITF